MVEGFTYVHEHGPDNYPGPPTTPSQLSRKAHGGRAARWQHSRTIIMHGPDYLIAHPASSREGWGLERAMKGIVRRGSWKGLKGLLQVCKGWNSWMEGLERRPLDPSEPRIAGHISTTSSPGSSSAAICFGSRGTRSEP